MQRQPAKEKTNLHLKDKTKTNKGNTGFYDPRTYFQRPSALETAAGKGRQGRRSWQAGSQKPASVSLTHSLTHSPAAPTLLPLLHRRRGISFRGFASIVVVACVSAFGGLVCESQLGDPLAQ